MCSMNPRSQASVSTAVGDPAPELPSPDMVWIPGGTFRMGSDHHYPEERPVHRVTVDGFWMDRHPVTNARFARFVEATGHVTFAEIPPNPADYPGALPDMLYAGSLVFVQPAGPVDRRDFTQLVAVHARRRLATSVRARTARSTVSTQHPVVHVTFADAEAFAAWEGKTLPTEAEWELAARGGLDGAPYAWGDDVPAATIGTMANTWQGEFPWQNLRSRRLRAHVAGRRVSAERLRPLRHDRQRVGMDHGLVSAAAPARRGQAVLHPAATRRGPRVGRELRSVPAGDRHPAQGAEGRLAPVRAELLPAISPRGALPRARGHVHVPRRVPLHPQTSR